MLSAAAFLAGCTTTNTTKGSSPQRELEPLTPSVILPSLPAVTTPVTRTEPIQQSATPTRHYRFTVDVLSPQKTLEEAATRLLQAEATTLPSSAIGTGMFRLQITAQQRLQQGSQPRLVGKLMKTQQQADYAISFVLTGVTGTPLTQGSITVSAPPKETVYPAPPIQENQLDSNLAQMAIQKILPQVLPHIKAASWQTRVFGTVNPQHVSLPIGQESGLQLGDILETATLPLAKLQVVSFEQPVNNSQYSKAILRLMVGQLPAPGKFLVPQR